jgi:tetratricopeptide (TPR) repeat protein
MAFNKAKALQEAQKYVTQGKISQAIKLYQQIIERDPSDLIFLNTIGDLYIREKHLSEALKQFYRLAEAYVNEGYVVKAIAIYKKISKLDQGSIEPILKLAELYVTQGLNREAREQYGAALELYKKSNQRDKALEVVRKMAQLDPQNPKARLRLAELAEQMGQTEEAAEAYLEAATLLQREGDSSGAESTLGKAARLSPNNLRIQLSLARQAFHRQSFDEAERILTSAPSLTEDAAARRLLLECYLATHKLSEAKKILLEVYRGNSGDFSPISNFAALCIARKDYDGAFEAASLVAQDLVERRDADALMQTLRKIWAEAPQHLPTLELIYQISEKTGDEFTIPEVLEALGHAYVQTGELQKAEAAYAKLAAREPENENYRDLLRQVLQKQGKEYVPASASVFASEAMALESPVEMGATADEAAMVKEAIESSDVFVRYNLPEKAVAELEKVLAVYPNQTEIHKRILEACRKNLPHRSALAADALARIYKDRGDFITAQHYQEIALQLGEHEPSAESFPSAPSTPAVPELPQEIDLSQEFGISPSETAEAEEPKEIPLDLVSGTPEIAAPSGPLMGPASLNGAPATEISQASGAPFETEPEVARFNYQDNEQEIRFYLSQGLVAEATKAVEEIRERYPGHPDVQKLADLVEASAQPRSAPAGPAASTPTRPTQEEDWELPTSFVTETSTPSTSPTAEQPRKPSLAGGSDLLGSLANDLEASFGEIETPEKTAPMGPAQPSISSGANDGVSPLSDLLSELGEVEPSQAGADDPETHYNLGVAFREMGLLDEAIGEFQKVVKGSSKGNLPPNYLQACTLLAVSFRDKGMPAIAVKWYLRALEIPGLEEEATLALLYDLGVAHEEAGDIKKALEKFTEVYSQNIDYRDVAEKIRLLQQKAS